MQHQFHTKTANPAEGCGHCLAMLQAMTRQQLVELRDMLTLLVAAGQDSDPAKGDIQGAVENVTAELARRN